MQTKRGSCSIARPGDARSLLLDTESHSSELADGGEDAEVALLERRGVA
jgi:hypothetical protein